MLLLSLYLTSSTFLRQLVILSEQISIKRITAQLLTTQKLTFKLFLTNIVIKNLEFFNILKEKYVFGS
jgi:hypothetical protein